MRCFKCPFTRLTVMELLLNKIVSRHTSDVVERDLTKPINGGLTPPGFKWRLATPADFEADDETLHLNPGRRRFAQSLLETGSVCHIAEYDGERAHIRWMTFDRLQTVPYDISLASGWVYLSRVRTAPKFRGMGIQQAGFRVSAEYAIEHGARRIVGIVDLDNDISLHVAQKMGYEITGQIAAWRICGLWDIQRVPAVIKSRLSSPAA